MPDERASSARARVLAAYAADALERSGRPDDAGRVAADAVALAIAAGSALDEGHARHVLGLALAGRATSTTASPSCTGPASWPSARRRRRRRRRHLRPSLAGPRRARAGRRDGAAGRRRRRRSAGPPAWTWPLCSCRASLVPSCTSSGQWEGPRRAWVGATTSCRASRRRCGTLVSGLVAVNHGDLAAADRHLAARAPDTPGLRRPHQRAALPGTGRGGAVGRPARRGPRRRHDRPRAHRYRRDAGPPRRAGGAGRPTGPSAGAPPGGPRRARRRSPPC